MELQQRQQLRKYLDLISYHWKLIFFCFLLGLTIGLVMYLKMPKLYRSSALLNYEPQAVQFGPKEREGRNLKKTVSTLRDLVLSRNNLEQIIKQFDLYPEERNRLPIEDVILIMRQNIKIALSSGHADTFSVAFIGKDQAKVQKVTNALASKFIEENLKFREERATATSEYTSDELKRAKDILDQKEQVMRDYKLRYYNELPDQQQSNIARLNALHTQYQSLQNSIQDLERTKIMAQEQLALRKRLSRLILLDTRKKGEEGESVISPTRPSVPDNFARLHQLKQYLATLQTKYTGRHPEIRRTKKLIAQLEKQLAGQEQPLTVGKVEEKNARPSLDKNQDLVAQRLSLQIKEIDMNIKELKDQQKTVQKEIEKYKKWIAAAPVREAEWSKLTRDYAQLKGHYEKLVQTNLRAEAVQHLERKQKGSKFAVVDPARFPDQPYRPVFAQVMLLAAGLGLGIGVAMAFLMDFIDTSFRDTFDLEQYLGLRVASTVPYIFTNEEELRNKTATVLWGIFFVVYSGVLIGVFYHYYQIGMINF